MPDTEIPKMQVHVATLKPWEAVLLVPTDGDEPIIATMDRRQDDEFQITVARDRIVIHDETEMQEFEEEPRQVRCPSCASADLEWQADRVDVVHLVCHHCSERIIEADLPELLGQLSSDVIYEAGFDWRLL